MTERQLNLPPGWDCKVDERTGKHYYINHYTKTTTWEDPRNRHRPFMGAQKSFSNIQTEHIPLQHGSPELRRNYVYPSQTTPIPAFQMPAHMSPKSVPFQDLKPRMSPLTVRSKVQDTSLTTVPDDDPVAKISAMFPTVSETHIKMLLKKYHSREALVISALQVEKYPITTPGPFATPPPQRNIHQPSPLALRGHSRGGSPIFNSNSNTGSPRIGDFRNSPRPHSSPKLKLSCRYMKSVFPQADETVILEVLQNHENNIQKTADALKEMGFDKKDTVKVAQQKMEAKKEQKREKKVEERPPTPPVVIKTAEEKKRIKTTLQEKYKDVAEYLISIALESVNFDESRASQILQIMVQEDTQSNSNKQQEIRICEDISEIASTSGTVIPSSQSRQSIKSMLKTEKELDKTSYSRVIEENGSAFRSSYLSNTKGPDSQHAKGANENLLLENYLNWQGPNADFKKGSQTLAKGPDSSLLSGRTHRACGPNSDLRKGSKFGLAKGSIFSHLQCIVRVGDSRGN